jgi:two-component system sensor histidine kinase GlrK
MWQALSLIPFALLVTMAITYMIARPLRQIDNAIHDLGSGKLSEKIQVSGPEDLRMLGERLEWLRAQLAQLEEQKSRFLREVSHELKTPLTAIREGAELLNEGVGGQLSGQQQEIAIILRENSLRLQRLIEGLLNYSATRFQADPIKAQVALHKVLQRVLDDHALPISSRQLKLLSHIGETQLPGDEARLATLCDNLISNAIKFAPHGGIIRIRLTMRDNLATLDVLDNGPGIAAEDRAHLFEPFFQGHAPQEGHVKGSGLGLSIARDCVLAHGGKIEIMDNPAWQGAHFRVSLPIHPINAEADEIE